MSLFHSTIDPFSAYTINLGPLYVERVFDSLLTKQGIKEVRSMGPASRYMHYLAHLRKMAGTNCLERYEVIQFYKGYFYQQLANYSARKADMAHLQEKALCHYETYLEFTNSLAESRYYAQWQTGLLQDTLQYPWALAEDSLLKASSIDTLRGESIKKIIDHYIQEKDWETAYYYSSAAINKFLDKNPIASRKWFIDCHAYDWTIVRIHRIICYKCGYIKEKKSTHGESSDQTAPQSTEL
jgi:hypothetical protein